ncbi:MAG: SDR family oxidoreductase [Chloroflexota bacterium]
METILITGATGNVGAEVVRSLPDTVQGRLAVRNVRKAQSQIDTVHDFVPFDFLDSHTFAPALTNVDRVFLVRPPQLADVSIFEAFINVASECGIKQIVFLSLQGIERVYFVPHAKIEKAIIASGIPFTFLRAGFFMQNLDTTHRQDIAEKHDVFVPAGNSQTAFIDVRDIGAVAAHVLTTTGHKNRAYTLTGRELLNYHEVAKLFSDVLPFTVTYSDPNLLHFAWRFWRRGIPLGQVLVMCFLYTMTRFGQAAKIHDDVEKLLGRPPIKMRQYIEDYQQVWH